MRTTRGFWFFLPSKRTIFSKSNQNINEPIFVQSEQTFNKKAKKESAF
jgi:hypothetical protein